MHLKTPIATVVRIVFIVIAIWLPTISPIAHNAIAQQPESAQPTARIPVRPRSSQRFYDQGNLIPSSQRQAFESELGRARDLGVDMIVYTRLSTDDQQTSQEFADQLRTTWNIESSPGADDGLVILLTYDYSTSKNHSLVAAWGSNTFPIRQLTAAGFQRTLDDEMRPAMERGDFELALMFGVRRIINYAEYSPPNPPPLGRERLILNSVAGIGSVALLQIAVLGYFIAGVTSKHRFTFKPSIRALIVYAISIAIAAIAVGLIAIAGRNGPATLLTLGLFLWSSLGILLVSDRFYQSSARNVSVRSTATGNLRFRVRRRHDRHNVEVPGRV